MAHATLEQVQVMIDDLTPLEQARLLSYLTPRIIHAVEMNRPEADVAELHSADSWEAFFRIGDEIAASDTAEGETLTAAVVAMRR